MTSPAAAVLIGLLVAAPFAAQADGLAAWCDPGKPFVVLAPKDRPPDNTETGDMIGKFAENGRDMAGLGGTGYILSNTLEPGGALKLLQGLGPRFATAEMADALVSFVRSGAFKAGAVGVALAGASLFIYSLVDHTPQVQPETASDLASRAQRIGLPKLDLRPCPIALPRPAPAFDLDKLSTSLRASLPPGVPADDAGNVADILNSIRQRPSVSTDSFDSMANMFGTQSSE